MNSSFKKMYGLIKEKELIKGNVWFKNMHLQLNVPNKGNKILKIAKHP
jgi:hypothetical protein